MAENTVVSYVNQKSNKTLNQKIDCDISSEVLKITLSLFMYYLGKKEDFV